MCERQSTRYDQICYFDEGLISNGNDLPLMGEPNIQGIHVQKFFKNALLSSIDEF